LAIGWITLTVVLSTYVVMLGWGPDLTTVGGLTTQVVSQKLVAKRAQVIA
jgi:hypothetical protein